jgi:glucans biosynthesis protein C
MNTSRPSREGHAPDAPSLGTDRETYIDALRIAALGLLILYHVGMAYASWDWHVKSAWSPTVAAGVENVMRLTGAWRMTLLFVVSGLALSLMLQRRGNRPGWLRGRAKRLLLPLVTGVVLVVPLQSYFEVRQFHGFTGSFVDFLKLYFTAHRFCSAERGCLILPTWNHLWFLPYLFVYTAALAGVLARWPQAVDRAAAALAHRLSGTWLIVAPIGWFVLTRFTLAPIFGQTHALVDDGFAHSQYAAAFAIGVLLARPAAATLLPRLQSTRHVALVLTLLCWALLVATEPGRAWRGLPWSVMQWCGVLAAIGYARVHLWHEGALPRDLTRYLSGAVFPVYVFHQTITVAAVAALAPLHLPFAAEVSLLVVLTFALSFAGYEVVRRVPALRIWFGVAPTGPSNLIPGMTSKVIAQRAAARHDGHRSTSVRDHREGTAP